MAGVDALISSLLSSIVKLLPEIKNSFFAPSSSSSSQSPNANTVENDLNALMRMLKRIKATLYDAEEREIKDNSVKLWLKELREVGHGAEYVIDEYMYEVYRAQIEARNASELNPRKRKQEASGVASCAHSIRVPDGFVDRIREIRKRFDEIAKDREALRLREEDGLRRDVDIRFRAPSSHLILEPNVFGRKRDKENVIDLLFSNLDEGIITVIPIIGKGGLGKTTLAQLVYNDRRVKQKFDLYGWICVSEYFNVERLTQDTIESFTRNNCSIRNLDTLQEKLKGIVERKRVFIVLDDVWVEDDNFWKLFRAPFMYALRVAFIITTRSDRVAKIMQTTPPFRLGYLPGEESWSLFQHYAFGGNDYNVQPNLSYLGRQITEKCGGLPLAIKSISNLLRYENEEGWEEILKNELWKLHANNEIFGALQISYTHMPAYLRPCFVYCSLFPKDYEYDLDEMIELWITQGYIECKERRTLEELAFEYAVELRERSFFDHVYKGTTWKRFKLHDIIHDLARINSGNEVWPIERGKQPNLPDEVLHIYMDDFQGSLRTLNLNNVARLRTILLATTSTFIDFSEAKSLRILKLDYKSFFHGFRRRPVISDYPIFSLYHLEKLNLNLKNNSLDLEMIGNLVNLKFLSLLGCNIEKIPESLCFLNNLRMLSIKDSTASLLPQNIGNLHCLEKLVIDSCRGLRFLPESLCKLSGLKSLSLTYCSKIRKLPDGIGKLTNLQSLIMSHTIVSCLPHSFSKLNISGQLSVEISPSLSVDGLSNTISCLKDFNILKGALVIVNLGNITDLEDAQNFNLIDKPNLKKLAVVWSRTCDYFYEEENKIIIILPNNGGFTEKIDIINRTILQSHPPNHDFMVLESLQPHPNLKHLLVDSYKDPIFPGWMGDRLFCASLERIDLTFCDNITRLPFGFLGSLKHLLIHRCNALPIISGDFLPWQLQRLEIGWCGSLCSVTGLADLELLDSLEIRACDRLIYFPFELISEERCYKPSSFGLKNIFPPKKVTIQGCPSLVLAENEVIPSLHCNIYIFNCEGLKKWCFRHNISYDSGLYFERLPDSSVDGASSAHGASDGLVKPTSEVDEVGSSPSQTRHIRAEKGSHDETRGCRELFRNFLGVCRSASFFHASVIDY